MEIAENLLNNDKAMTYDLKKFFPITVHLNFDFEIKYLRLKKAFYI